MKQKPDETLDQWVQQTLRQLLDTSPSGSSFDSERLWTQLRPALQPAPSDRKRKLTAWLAAACLTGLMLGWLWRQQSDSVAPKMAKLVNAHNLSRVKASHHRPNVADRIASRKPIPLENEQHSLNGRAHTRQREEPKVEATSVPAPPTAIIDQTPESSIVADIAPSAETIPERSKPNVAKNIPKRRFQVVHENELRAEEATRPKLYRSEHFVRLGTEHNEEPAQEQRPPTLRVPLTTKSN